MNTKDIRVVFKKGSIIKAPAIKIHPTFWQKLKLLFSKSFQVRVGNQKVKHTFLGKAKAIFSKEFSIKAEGRVLGYGLFEVELEKMGFQKRKLKKLVDQKILSKVTTRFKNSWRTTYVLPEEAK